MTVTDQLKIIDNKIKANQAQYDFDRLVAKISAYSSSDDLRNYEYLTGENLGYRPNVLEKTKFDYSPLDKVFSRGLTENQQKEGLLKRMKNIEDKNVFSQTNKVSKAAKNKSLFNYDSEYAFDKFQRSFKKFKRM